jgi:hypothetical protein
MVFKARWVFLGGLPHFPIKAVLLTARANPRRLTAPMSASG